MFPVQYEDYTDYCQEYSFYSNDFVFEVVLHHPRVPPLQSCMSCVLSLSSPELSVAITVDYTPAPDEAPGELAANEFTAGSALSLNCMVQGASGTLNYSWSVEGNPATPPECAVCGPPTSHMSTLQLGVILFSYRAGNYTCSVSESGRPGSGNSDSYTVRVVGMLL